MSKGKLVHPFVALVVPVLAFIFIGLIVVARLVIGPATQMDIEQQRLRIAFEESSQEEVGNCLSMNTPWRCLQKMSVADAASPAPAGAGHTRVSYLVHKVPAKDALQFCSATKEDNCAEKLVGYGYSNADVLEALRTAKT